MLIILKFTFGFCVFASSRGERMRVITHICMFVLNDDVVLQAYSILIDVTRLKNSMNEYPY